MENIPSPDHSSPLAGRLFAWLAVIGLIVGLTAFYHVVTQRDSSIIETVGENGNSVVSLQRDRTGHFLAQGLINGHEVMFLVDTGATDVAVSEAAAREMGLKFGPRITVLTAAGPSPAWRTRLDQVSIGSLALNNVRAVITPGLGNKVLLGMSFLQYFDWRQEGDRLVLEAGK